MVDATSQKCGHQGCNTFPVYGVKGNKKMEFCGRHAREGMVDVISKRCGQKQASYGVTGLKMYVDYVLMPSSAFSTPGWAPVDVISRRCGHQGCNVQPSYGAAGTKKTEFCVQHSRERAWLACAINLWAPRN